MAETVISRVAEATERLNASLGQRIGTARETMAGVSQAFSSRCTSAVKAVDMVTTAALERAGSARSVALEHAATARRVAAGTCKDMTQKGARLWVSESAAFAKQMFGEAAVATRAQVSASFSEAKTRAIAGAEVACQRAQVSASFSEAKARELRA